MPGKIAFEEHMSLEETLEDSRSFAGGSGKWDEFARQILDLDEERLAGMEQNGIDFTILSLNAPAVQAILDTTRAIEVSRRANDRIAAAVARHPRKFAGFAALPMQDPDAASMELTRCVKELEVIGDDRLMFSADYPFEKMEDAANWFDNTKLSDEQRLKIGRTNALKLFNLNLGG